MARYVELRAASAFSFLSAASVPEDLADQAARLGCDSMALADRDGVSGIPRFIKACRAGGIRPICGARISFDPGTPFLTRGGRLPQLLLLCRDGEGWGNLCQMITMAHSGREKDMPVAGWDLLEELHHGLVCLAGSMDGPVTSIAATGERTSAASATARLASIFGRDSLFLDLQRHGDPVQESANRFLADIAGGVGIRTIATNDVRYADAAASRVFDVLQAIRNHVTLDAAATILPAGHRHLQRDHSTMESLFYDMPGIIDRTGELAESLRFDPADIEYRFPEYPVTAPTTPDSLLRQLVEAGLTRRYSSVTQGVRGQVEHELQIIGKLGLAGYFLLVQDIVGFCGRNGILAQGRGSAASSVVCYALGITAIDPVGMGLLFERFLSEERGEWPDIDLDLPSGEQREMVIQHVYEKYGVSCVGMTSAVSTFRGRSTIREAGAAFGLDPDCLARLARLVRPFDFSNDQESFLNKVSQAGLDPGDRTVQSFIDVWHQMQDLPRHIGQHNGGLVISGNRLDRVVPIVPARMAGRRVIQWDKDDIADMRMIKVDLLGLGMLAAISKTIELVSRHQGVDVDLAGIPVNDKDVWDMLCRADTIGVFQIESRAQMATLPRMRPRCFYDLVIEVAIIRPGPIVGKMVHPFLERRCGAAPVRYAAPCLQPILERTLGIPLFQEQLMRMAMTAAGFSGGESEELRRAMGSRRSRARMLRLVEKLHAGMERNGIEKPARDEIVSSIISFALYGFPESHAASFALIAWASAWLKFHHHAAFTASLLNCWPMGFYSPATLVRDAMHHNVPVLPIDVNKSASDCTLEHAADGKIAIRLGLKFIRGLAASTIDRIIRKRPTGGYRDITHVGEAALAGRSELMIIADAGAAPASGPGLLTEGRGTRRDALWQAMAFDPSATILHRNQSDTDMPECVEPLLEHSFEDMANDFRATGLTTGPHPIAFIRPQLEVRGIKPADGLSLLPDGAHASVAGMIIVKQRPPTAKGFYFATVEDESGHAAVAVSPAVFARNRTLLLTSSFLIFSGVVQNRSGVTSLLADSFERLPKLVNHPGRDFH